MGDLTRNFSRSEFASPDGRAMPAKYNANLLELATNLQVLRDTVGKPITIHSGYRSPEHNRAINGAPQSKHMTAQAADFSIARSTLPSVYCAIEHLIGKGEMKQGGLGIYAAHLHYDVRLQKVRWAEGVPVPDCAPVEPPAPPAPPEEEEDDMKTQLVLLHAEGSGAYYLSDWMTKRHVTMAELTMFRYVQVPEAKAPADILDAIPEVES